MFANASREILPFSMRPKLSRLLVQVVYPAYLGGREKNILGMLVSGNEGMKPGGSFLGSFFGKEEAFCAILEKFSSPGNTILDLTEGNKAELPACEHMITLCNR